MSDIPLSQSESVNLSGLESDLSGASEMTAAFGKELTSMRRALSDAGRDVTALDRSLSTGLTRAMRGAIVQGDTLSTSLRRISDTMINATLNAAIKPVAGGVGKALGDAITGIFNFSNDAGFAQGRVKPFADGGVVNGPVNFAMRGGLGVMGEAGPEAIIPLARGADGKLGIRAQRGAAPVHVVMNITTPDAESFGRSQGQIAARLGRVIGQGARNR